MFKLLLCQRYLRTRFIALASIVSVMLGVATMIVVNSVMSGFSTQMKERIQGLLSDVVIETHSLDGVPDYEEQMMLANSVAGEHIEAMTPTVESWGLMTFNYLGQWVSKPITLIGIEPDGKAKVGPLKDFLASYRPTIEQEQVVAEPLRSAEEEPSWNLTDEAQQYRKERIDQQMWYERQMEAARAHEALQNPVIEQASGTESEGIVVDLNSDPFGSPANTPAQPVDPYAMAKGRIYVGAGLVSYLYKDPKSGNMKKEMMLNPGDDVKISTLTTGRPPQHAPFHATVVDIFECGMTEYDNLYVYCNLDELQTVKGMMAPGTNEKSITTIQIKLNDYSKADEVVERLRTVFPPEQFSVKTWEQKQGPLLAAVEVESAILNVLLFLIIAVAGFGILAIFFMIVVEKTRDIGILKALGASSNGVMSIFLGYGLALGIVGSGVGVVLGLLFVIYINEIEDVITFLTGRKVFDETIYYFPEIPTAIEPTMVISVAFGAMLIAVAASVLPARRAAMMHPVEALRND